MKWPRVRRLPPVVATLLIGHLAAAVVAGAAVFGLFGRLELLVYDQGLRWRAHADGDDGRVALVAVTEDDLMEHGWPLSDAILAATIVRLRAGGARAIAIDFFRDRPVGPGSADLAAVLDEADVVWPYGFDRGWAVWLRATVRAADQVAFSDMLPDPDGVIRRGLLFLDDGHRIEASLALTMALRLLEAGGVRLRPAPDAPEALRLGDVVLRPLEADEGGYVGVDDRGYQFLIDYRRGVDFLPRYWLSDVLEGRVPEDAFAGRLVFVGAMTETVKDYFYTPFNETSAVTDAVVPYAVPGVTLHAIMTDQLLRHALDGAPPTRTTGWPVEVLVIWLACLAGGALGLLLPSTLQFATGMAAGLGGLALLWFAALGQAIWLPLVAPAAGWLASGALVVASVSKAQAAARSELMRLLSMHVSAPIARELWRHRDMLLEQGRLVPQRLVATVLFSDIRDSSGVAERLEPQRLAEWLNEYFQVMVDIVAAHDGIVIRFIGDAILAVFGLPVPREGEAAIRADAVRATRCAAAMAEALVRLNRNLEARGLPPIAIRIGLHTGSLAAGSLGSARRLEYNVIGDTVNTAARLEALGKDIAENRAENRVWGHPCTIIVGAATWHRLGGTFAGEAIGTVALRGKAEEILAYRLVPSQADAAVPTREDSHVRQNDRTGIGSGACRAGRGG